MIAAAPSVGHLLTSWHAGPGLLLPVAAAALYAAAAARGDWPPLRTASFLAGCAALAAALASGLDALDDRLLSVHMGQHIALTTFAAPLMVAGAPVTLAFRTLRGPRRRALAALLHTRAIRTLSHPVVAFTLFSAVLLGAHVPAVFEATLRHPLLHDVEHAAFFWTAVAFWAPLVAVDPLPHRPGFLGRLVVLLATMPVMGALTMLLSGGQRVLYPAYEAPAAALGVSALADQRYAAGLMMTVGMTATAAAALLIAWSALAREERRARAREMHADAAQARAMLEVEP